MTKCFSVNSRRHTHSGLTLIELLAVIAVVGILVMMLLPAVQSAREAGRRTTCKDHLKQIALAIHAHHDSQGHFPSGGWGFRWVGDPDRGYGLRQPGGWIYNMLPFVEEQSVHDMGKGLPNSATHKWGIATKMLQMPIALFTCPTRRDSRSWPVRANRDWMLNANKPDLTDGWTRSCYAANLGEIEVPWTEGPGNMAMGDAGIGFNNMSAVTGISCQHRLFDFSNVTDGLAHTYLIGEKGISSDDYYSGTDASDDEPMLSGVSADLHCTSSRAPRNDQPGASNRYQWGGPHRGIVLIAFCDGSVHSIPVDIDLVVHRRLGNRKDGRPLDQSQF